METVESLIRIKMNSNKSWTNRIVLSLIKSIMTICFLNVEGVFGQNNDYIEFEIGDVIYENSLSSERDIEKVVIESSTEGQPVITFNNGGMQLESGVHFLLWFPDDFSDNIAISWDFLPKNDDGLAMFWFHAMGKKGENLFDTSLQERTGKYSQYNRGDINAYHVAYYRRNPWDDPHLNTVNLRKSHGHHLAVIRANPIPSVKYIEEPYRINVIKSGPYIRMTINDILILDWKDDIGDEYWKEGKIGFRQMANLVAEYSNLRVNKVLRVNK